MGTLSLGKAKDLPKVHVSHPKPIVIKEIEATGEEPELDPSAHYGEVGGVPGVKYVQGDYFFKPDGSFHSLAPEGQRLAPLTKEQEADRQRRMAQVKKLWGSKLAQSAAAIPASVVAAEKENARARAAEALSE